jgi:GGDEF domain-containing protein
MAEQNNTADEQSAQPTRNLVYFDDRTALHLTQAFAHEVELEPLLELLFSQLQATSSTEGLQYKFQPLGIDLNFGQRDLHTADYNLSFRDNQLGKLVLYFSRPQHEQSIQTCEDLISMAFPSIRNAVRLLEVGNEPAPLTKQEKKTVASIAPLPKEEKTDALILLALDDYPAIKARDGEEWAQVLMSSVHEQIKEGLRDADGVYHIGDDLIAVLLPNTTGGRAEDVAKKVRALIASLHLRNGGGNGGGDGGSDGELSQQLTACMGLADARTAATAEGVMDHAKQALRKAQTEGANQINIYQPAPVSALEQVESVR